MTCFDVTMRERGALIVVRIRGRGLDHARKRAEALCPEAAFVAIVKAAAYTWPVPIEVPA